MIAELGEKHLLLPFIDGINRLEQCEGRTMILASPDQRLDILGEA